MRCDRIITIAAVTLFALFVTARADDEDGLPRKSATETTEQRRDTEATERERRRDREAAQQERRRDAETAEGERRREEADRDRERPNPFQRGRARGEGMTPRMPGLGGMRGMGGPMRGMMMGPGMDAAERMDGRPPMERLRETDPEMFELEQNDQQLDRASHELAEQYRRACELPGQRVCRAKRSLPGVSAASATGVAGDVAALSGLPIWQLQQMGLW